jgi:hypothetical protein
LPCPGHYGTGFRRSSHSARKLAVFATRGPLGLASGLPEPPVDGGDQASATSADGLPIAKPDFAPALRVVAMRTPLFVLRDTVAQFPTCSEAYLVGVEALDV